VKPYLFRLWVGSESLSEVAEECAEVGLHVAMLGSEHVYILHEAYDAEFSDDHITSLLTPRPGMIPVLWAALTPEQAIEMRSAYRPGIDHYEKNETEAV
jgi:hypothetical protein